ncbi:MAG: pantetheine-phosphate adenylyltransferase [Verrucomicrobiales bacterium]|nr:pantetheine-phosphate adenylyltransferase [Verrucomicrobiales bacterium]|tara:strand:- start:1448 stop:1942 length:495 start_codon:yes stop_codon:yes gene_type:complete
MKRAVYAGSFDPLTNGHVWMIEEGAKLFDELIVAIGINPDKQYTFNLDDRLTFLQDAVGGRPHVKIDSFENQFLVHYAAQLDAGFILRGIRTETDYDYERGMRHINSDLRPEVTSVFLIPPREIAEVSSSFVKGLIGPDGWEEIVKQYVPEGVYRALEKQFAND